MRHDIMGHAIIDPHRQRTAGCLALQEAGKRSGGMRKPVGKVENILDEMAQETIAFHACSPAGSSVLRPLPILIFAIRSFPSAR
jgi:hypothetical protein